MTTWTGSTGIDSAFLEMMPDTVSFYAQTTSDKYGKPTFSGTATSVRGRVVYDQQKINTEFGEEVNSSGHVYLYGNYSTITTNHKLTLPDTTSPVILRVENKKDTAGVHHTIVWFGRG